MDKLKKFLTVLKKYQFWVVCGAVLLVAIVCWWLATSGLAGQFQQRKTKLEGEFKGVVIPPDHPNQDVIDKIDKQHEVAEATASTARGRFSTASRRRKTRFPKCSAKTSSSSSRT